MAVTALAMMIDAKDGGKTGATVAEAQMTNGAAEVAVGASSLQPPILMPPKTEAEEWNMVKPMRGPTGAAAGAQMLIPFRRLGSRALQYKKMLRPLNNCLNLTPSRKIHRHAVSAHLRAV